VSDQVEPRLRPSVPELHPHECEPSDQSALNSCGPCQVRALTRFLPLEMARAQHGVAAGGRQSGGGRSQTAPSSAPGHASRATDLVVLAPGVVVPPLAVAELITASHIGTRGRAAASAAKLRTRRRGGQGCVARWSALGPQLALKLASAPVGVGVRHWRGYACPQS